MSDGWIPLSQQYPEPECDVLVSIKGCITVGMYWSNECEDDDDIYWWFHEECLSGEEPDAWMKLPSPYFAEKGDGNTSVSPE